MSEKVNKPKNMKENNVRLVLSTLYEKSEMTVQGITAKTGMSKTTVNKLLLELTGTGIVRALGKGESTAEGGRKPERYCFNELFQYIISLQIYDSYSWCAIMDLKCKILYNYTQNHAEDIDFESVVEESKVQIRRGIQTIGLTEEQIGALVVSCSAIVNEETGMMVSQTIGSWDNNLAVMKQFDGMFERKIPIIVNNIAMFSGYSELIYRPELKDSRLFVMLFWDDNVGSAVIRNGKAETGAHNLLSEIGHIRLGQNLDAISREFETLVGTKGILEYANKNGRQNRESVLYPAIKNKTLTLEQVFDAFRKEDEFAVSILERSAYYIAMVMQCICYIYDPQDFIIQGYYYQAGSKFLEMIRKNLQRMVPYADVNRVRIEYSSFLGEYRAAYNFGACLYAVEKLAKDNYGLHL